MLGFCREQGLSTEGSKIVQRVFRDPSDRMVDRIDLDIRLPAGFPEKYCEAVIHSAEPCAVKKHLERPPRFEITTSMN